MKKSFFLSFFLALLLILNFISASEISGSFTITGEAIEEVDENNNSQQGEDSFLNSIKNFFIYAFNIGGEFEIGSNQSEQEPISDTEGDSGGGDTGGETIKPLNQSDDSKDKIPYPDESAKIESEKQDETDAEMPFGIKEVKDMFTIVIIIIVLVFLLSLHKILRLFRY